MVEKEWDDEDVEDGDTLPSSEWNQLIGRVKSVLGGKSVGNGIVDALEGHFSDLLQRSDTDVALDGDAQPPESHDNDDHTETYITDTLAHDFAGGKHNSDTLAHLNSKIDDAVLDDESDTREPTEHVTTHEAEGGDEITLQNLKDVFGVSQIKMDTSDNLTAGTADRLCIERDTGRVLYDDGSSFVEVGLSEDQIELGNLGSKTHGELSNAPIDSHLDVLASGTITLTGGISPAFDDVLGLALSETEFFDVVLASQGATFDYAFNYDWGRTYNSSADEMDVNLTVNWDNDPGDGNDVSVDYKIIRRG